MAISYIYMLEIEKNNEGGKYYIGRAVDLNKRLATHISGKNESADVLCDFNIKNIQEIHEVSFPDDFNYDGSSSILENIFINRKINNCEKNKSKYRGGNYTEPWDVDYELLDKTDDKIYQNVIDNSTDKIINKDKVLNSLIREFENKIKQNSYPPKNEKRIVKFIKENSGEYAKKLTDLLNSFSNEKRERVSKLVLDLLNEYKKD